MISRPFLIIVSFFMAAYRLSQGAWVDAIGLLALGGGLVLLHFGRQRPTLKPFAWGAFGVTAVAMLVSYLQRF